MATDRFVSDGTDIIFLDDDDGDATGEKGGAGSGNFGHLGRAGKVGGSGQGGGPVKDQEGKYIPGSVGKTLGIDTSSWDKSSSNAQWAMKKLHKLEQLAEKGQWDVLASHLGWSTNAQYPDKYKKAVLQAQVAAGALKTKAVQQPPPGTTPVAAPPVPALVPKWTKVGGQLGSNPGGTYEFEGKKFYVKFPKDEDHARSEVLACKLYELAGTPVVKAHLVEIDGKTGIATEWLETKAMDYGNLGQKQLAQQDFAAHAWLNNWDAVGAVGDTNNIRMSADGKATMVDAGGSLDFKATGGKKPFTDQPAAWDDMRNPSINPSAAKVFDSMTPAQLQMSAAKLKSVTNEQIIDLVAKHGPGGAHEKFGLSTQLAVRRDAIIKRAEDDFVTWAGQQVAAQPGASVTQILQGAKPAPISKVPMAVPPPPKVASYAKQHGDKMEAIHAAAQTGNIAAVEKIKTNGNASSPWPSKVHAYKMQVLAAMQSGGKATAEPTVKGTSGQPIKIKTQEFPTKPVFVSKNTAQKAANEAAMNQAWEHAEKGDLASLQSMKLTESPKLKTWHASLVSTLSAQLNPPPPPKKIAESYKSATAHVAGKPGKEGLQKIGYWAVLGDIGGVPERLPKGSKMPDEVWDKGYNKFADLSPAAQKKLKSYTGSGYGGINSSLRTESKPTAEALLAANAVMKSSIDLPVGSKLYRKHGGSADEFKHLRPGMVVADKGILSTASTEHTWSGNIQWSITIGEGVKGLPAKQFSYHKSENEVLLPPNSRMLITSVEKQSSSYWKVHAVALPTQPNQCCPP